MAVRQFGGDSDTDHIVRGVGALTGMAYGTIITLAKFSNLNDDRYFWSLKTSGGDQKLSLWEDDPDGFTWGTGDGDNTGGASVAAATVWLLIICRKPSGDENVRWSVYNYDTESWTHTDSNASCVDATGPGAGGTLELFFSSSSTAFSGLLAAQAAWSDSLPWSADASGDAAIEAAGLETSLANWDAEDPDAGWAFNQESTSTAVEDWTGNGADQTAITGTSVVTDDDPPGFSFDLAAGEPYGRATETETARGFAAAGTVAYGRTTETETARAFTSAGEPVRYIDTDDDIVRSIGALSAMTHGTIATIVKRQAVGTNTDRYFFVLQTDGADGKLNMWFEQDSDDVRWGDGDDTNTGSTALVVDDTDHWYLIVARKPTGDQHVRLSMYNFTTESWSHGSGSDTVTDAVPVGATGEVRFLFESVLRAIDGRIAAQAAWSNTLPWSADSSGDTAIENAGLEDGAANWLGNSPHAMWLFNQSDTSDPVLDVTGNGADQTAVIDTSVVAGDAPPGFDFSLDAVEPYGRVAETETARGFTAAKAVGFGRTAETETARAFGTQTGIAYGRVTETGTTRTFTPAKTVAYGRVTEAETVRAFTGVLGHTYGRVTETETVRGFAPTLTLGRVAETETVRAFSASGIADPNPIALAFTESAALALTESASLSHTESASVTHRESA